MNCTSCGAELTSQDGLCPKCGVHQLQKKKMSNAELFFSFSGRIPRATYWLRYWLPFTVVYILALILDLSLGTMSEDMMIGVFTGIYALVVLYPGLAVMVKRCHDRNRTGWFVLLTFIPFLNIWPMIEIAFLRGTIGPNKYGDDPIS